MNREFVATLVVGAIGVVIFYVLGTWLVSQDFWLSTLFGWLCYGLCVFFVAPYIFLVVFFFERLFEDYGGWIILLIILLYLFGFLDWIIEYISEYISRFFNEA